MRVLLRFTSPSSSVTTAAAITTTSSSLVVASLFSSLFKNSTSDGKSKKIDAKFTPPPPIFGFAARQQSNSAKDDNDENNNKNTQEQKQTSASSTARKTYVYGSAVNHNIFSSSRFQYINLSVRDVIEEIEAEAISTMISTSDRLAAQRKIMEEAAEARRKRGGGENQQQHERVITISVSPTSSSSAFDLSASNSTSGTSTTSATSTALQQDLGVLRGPAEIILALRPLLSVTGKVDFSNVPSSVVRALVGHAGFGENPSLLLDETSNETEKEEDGKEKQELKQEEEEETGKQKEEKVEQQEEKVEEAEDEEGKKGAQEGKSGQKTKKALLNRDVVAAVTRTISPVGVIVVDQRRHCIKMRPGVSQLAARMDASLLELAPSSATSSSKKVQLGAVYASLTGTERAFVNDIGGLSRVALLFPKQFGLTQDLLQVSRLVRVVGGATNNSSTSPAQRTVVVEPSQKEQLQQQQEAKESVTGKEQQQQQQQEVVATGTVFEAGVSQFLSHEKKRMARSTTGTSLLQKGESIFADDEELD